MYRRWPDNAADPLLSAVYVKNLQRYNFQYLHLETIMLLLEVFCMLRIATPLTTSSLRNQALGDLMFILETRL